MRGYSWKAGNTPNNCFKTLPHFSPNCSNRNVSKESPRYQKLKSSSLSPLTQPPQPLPSPSPWSAWEPEFKVFQPSIQDTVSNILYSRYCDLAGKWLSLMSCKKADDRAILCSTTYFASRWQSVSTGTSVLKVWTPPLLRGWFLSCQGQVTLTSPLKGPWLLASLLEPIHLQSRRWSLGNHHVNC